MQDISENKFKKEGVVLKCKVNFKEILLMFYKLFFCKKGVSGEKH